MSDNSVVCRYFCPLFFWPFARAFAALCGPLRHYALCGIAALRPGAHYGKIEPRKILSRPVILYV